MLTNVLRNTSWIFIRRIFFFFSLLVLRDFYADIYGKSHLRVTHERLGRHYTPRERVQEEVEASRYLSTFYFIYIPHDVVCSFSVYSHSLGFSIYTLIIPLPHDYTIYILVTSNFTALPWIDIHITFIWCTPDVMRWWSIAAWNLVCS